MKKIIIIRCGDHGEEIKRVLKVRNFDDRCIALLNTAIQQWNEMSIDDPNWVSYPKHINQTLTKAGYEFEDVDFDIIDDWDES